MSTTSQSSSASAPAPHFAPNRIDAHHHPWLCRASEFDWIGESLAELRRDFLVQDFQPGLRSANVDADIAVQARRTLDETQGLLEYAARTNAIRGVVGGAPLLADDFPSALDRFANHRKLVGMRESVQAEPDGYHDQSAVDQGIAELTDRNLAYDLLIRDRQLKEAVRFVDRHPRQRFVLDHAAKPPVASEDVDPWRTAIRALGKRRSVFCKLSGLVTEANSSRWAVDVLRPYIGVCVYAFGPDRLMVRIRLARVSGRLRVCTLVEHALGVFRRIQRA